ncbi:hypothetical protein ABZY14_09950 [Streptomyces sp. NPDC006617]|uniref:hypothetical protein n=1 Tax=Streptomyces sp. NPDC006617 TaxID=3155354 RepID=UPI0033B60201
MIPDSGPRRPLTRTDDGGYRIDDPLTGRTHHFARPPPTALRSLPGSPTAISTRSASTTTHHEVVRRVDGTLALTRGYDSLDRLIAPGCTAPGDRLVAERSYTYRSDGHLTAVQDARGGDRDFDLDLHGRVTAVRATDWSERYVYDSAGNQTEAEWPVRNRAQEAVGPRTYTGTRLTRAGGVHYE